MTATYNRSQVAALYRGKWVPQAAAQHVSGRWLSAFSVSPTSGDLRFLDPSLPEWADIHVFGRDARGNSDTFAHPIRKEHVGADVLDKVPGRMLEVRRAPEGFAQTGDAPRRGRVFFSGYTSNRKVPYRLMVEQGGALQWIPLSTGAGRIREYDAGPGTLIAAVWMSGSVYQPLLVVRVGEEEWITRRSASALASEVPAVLTYSELDELGDILLHGCDFTLGSTPVGGRQKVGTVLAMAAALSHWPGPFKGSLSYWVERYYASCGSKANLAQLLGGDEKVPLFLRHVWAEIEARPQLVRYIDNHNLRWLLTKSEDERSPREWILDRAPKLISAGIFTSDNLKPVRAMLSQLERM